MAYYNNNRGFEINENKTAELLTVAVEKITTEEDIDTLTELIKLFKKNVPLTRRKYVTAYLLKETLKHYHSTGKFNNKNSKSHTRDESRNFKNDYKQNTKAEHSAEVSVTETEERPKHPRVQIDPDKATSIFISIGKNRRVYPRDLVGILIAIAGIDRERIGDIKVLANYSFVQLYTEDAQTAIDKLNGYDYRGRKLAVSYSHQKEEGIDAEATSSEDAEMAAEDAAAYAAAEKAAKDKEPFGSI